MKKSIKPIFYLIFVSTLLWFTAIAGQEPDAEILPPRLSTPGWAPTLISETVPFVGFDEVDQHLAVAPRQDGDVRVEGARGVYQRFTPTGWDIIFVTKGGGYVGYYPKETSTSYQTIAVSEAAEIHPRLNAGGTQVAYASDADGDFEIVTANVDGTGHKTLTANSTDDVNPTWSRDNQQIIFQAYRDGNPEIYSMNRDGSGAKNLTKSSGYDGNPIVSPDGNKIAFVSNRTGGYRIYSMNLDGSDLVQLSTYPLSFYPVWSPDGKHIAFSADVDGDQWLELFVMDADGSNQGLLYNDEAVTYGDMMVSAWSPDKKTIVFSQSGYTLFEGDLYLTSLGVRYGNLASNFSFRGEQFRIAQDWAASNFHWVSYDHIPPTTSMITPSGDFITQETQKIEWQADDGDGTGIRFYDVQIKKGADGAWEDWVTNSALDSKSYTPTAGEQVQFRARGIDRVYNKEPFGDPISLLFYSYDVAGRVTDNRNVPLRGVEITSESRSALSIITNDDGFFSGKMLFPGDHQYSATKENFGSLVNSFFDQERQALVDFYLPPDDDVMLDGSFEELNLPAWQISGGLNNAQVTSQHIGGKTAQHISAACNGESSFCLGGRTSIGDLHPLSTIKLALDPNGLPHIVYSLPQTNSEGNFVRTLYHREQGADGELSEPIIVLDNLDDVENLSVAFDNQGRLHVSFRNGFATTIDEQIRYLQRDQHGQWQDDFSLVAQLPGLSQSGTLFLGSAVTPMGDVDFFFVTNEADFNNETKNFVRHLRYTSNGEWVISERFTNTTGLIRTWGSRILTSPNGVAYFLYRPYSSSSDSFLATRKEDGTWIVQLDDEPASSERINTYDVTVDADEVIHLIYITQNYLQDDSIFYKTRRTGQAWTDPKLIGSADRAINQKRALQATDDGYLFYLERSYSESDGIVSILRVRDPVTGWDEPVVIERNLEDRLIASMSVDQNGNLYLLQYHDEAWEYVSQTIAPTDDTGFVSQQVTLPSSMHAPTLSFNGKLTGAGPLNQSQAEIRVTDSLSQTTIFTPSIGFDWSTHWVDLSSWAGETVTVSIGLDQKASRPMLSLFLDDVSVGSSYPDLWVSTDVVDTVQPGDLVTLTLTYGNRSAVLAENVQITATFAADLEVVGSTPAASTISPYTWDIGALDGGEAASEIVVVVRVSDEAPLFEMIDVSATIQSGVRDGDQSDNVRDRQLFTGTKLILPYMPNGSS